jgi:hypothetical protein
MSERARTAINLGLASYPAGKAATAAKVVEVVTAVVAGQPAACGGV